MEVSEKFENIICPICGGYGKIQHSRRITFTKNSIGKTVFFSKEAAIQSLNGKEYKLEEWI